MSMDPRHHLPLMFAVLDGEGTPEEVRELERILAEDGGARAEYEAVRRFFALLQGVPQVDPSPGVATAVERFQLSGPPRVSSPGAESGKSLLRKQEGISRIPRISYGLPAKEKTMSRNDSKLALWIGTGVAAAAVLISAFVFKFPPGGENVSGTVVPAQRYRAEQIKAEDVKLGDQAVAQLMQTEAFERIVKDPKMRALAQDPGFQALARTQALAAILRNADALVAQAKAVNTDALVAQAKAVNTDALVAQAKAVNTDALVAQAKAVNTDALVAQATSVEAMMTPQAWLLLRKYPEAITLMAHDPGLAALAANRAFANALRVNASVNAVAK
jgi:hypothetical protein